MARKKQKVEEEVIAGEILDVANKFEDLVPVIKPAFTVLEDWRNRCASDGKDPVEEWLDMSLKVMKETGDPAVMRDVIDRILPKLKMEEMIVRQVGSGERSKEMEKLLKIIRGEEDDE